MFERSANRRGLTSHNNPFFRYVPVTPLEKPPPDTTLSVATPSSMSTSKQEMGGGRTEHLRDKKMGTWLWRAGAQPRERAATHDCSGAATSAQHLPRGCAGACQRAHDVTGAHARVCHA
ncbi:hypothetical protein Pelo_19669 [Pelomyxa schiedti]|nr:hypothetical protein Pelo_19669 [Pelomyxa schiedti]